MAEARPGARSADQARNYRLVQVDSAFVGIISAAGTFLPVFLVRLGASGTELGLLSSLPALTAFALAIPFGRWLQGRRNILPWYYRLRMLGWLGYASMGIAAALLPPALAVPAMLAIVAVASLPSTAGLVTFPIVMDGLAGPAGRFDLLGRRWAIAGVTTSIAVILAGQALDLLPFPLNFELLLGGFTVAGVGSFLVSRRFVVPDQAPLPRPASSGPIDRLRALRDLVLSQRSFVRFELRSLLATASVGLAMPLLPLLYVRELQAPDSWIGIIGASQSAGAVLGYVIARPVSRRRGGLAVLLPSMLTLAVVPAVLSLVGWLPAVPALVFVAGLGTAGTQLALFDQLMERIPRAHGITFSSVDQSLQNFALIVSPSIGGLLAVTIGVRWGLVVTAGVALAAVALFALAARRARAAAKARTVAA